jgi:hypothetical protein
MRSSALRTTSGYFRRNSSLVTTRSGNRTASETIERVELHPAEDGFRIELVGEIAGMVALSAGAESVGSATDRASVKVVAGTGFEPVTFRL